MKARKLPRPVLLLLVSVLLNLACFTLLRFIFWRLFRQPATPVPDGELWKAFFIGFKFDLRLALLLNLPVFLIAVLPRINPFQSRLARGLVMAYLIAINLAVLLVYLVDFGHYAYLETRVNVTVLGFLRDFAISFQMVRETYPVGWGALLLLLVAAAVGWGVTAGVKRLAQSETGVAISRGRQAVIYTLTVALSAAGIYGNISFYPLRWSDAYFSTRSMVSALASNPILFFVSTLGKKQHPYDLEATRRAYPVMAEYLKLDNTNAAQLDYRRFVTPQGPMTNRPNVVMVFLESFAYFKTGHSGNPLNPTPHFDAIAKKGILFDHFYTPIVGTARSIFTAITGLPDVDAHRTSSRNPLLVSQHTIINNFPGYERFYFLGGSLNWANIRGLISHNLDGLRIYEEGSYTSPRTDVWGISDLHLFEEANRVLRQQKAPFFALIQTAGNHRPYTIPDDNRGFQRRDVKDSEVLPHGFISATEFNSFRFMDHSIGFFIEQAAKEAYFTNTVFMFFGDHGLPGYAQHNPKHEQEFQLLRFHVPFLIYAPSVPAAASVRDTIASEVDVLPTIATFTSTPHLNSTLGRDLLDTKYDGMRYAFTIDEQSKVPTISLLGREYFFQMMADGSGKKLYHITSANPTANVLAEHQTVAQEMEKICRSFYETARYMPYFNSPDKLKAKK